MTHNTKNLELKHEKNNGAYYVITHTGWAGDPIDVWAISQERLCL